MLHHSLVFSCVLACCSLLPVTVFAQTEKTKNASEKPVSETSVGPAGEKVVESLENNEDRELAESYEALARKFQENKNFKKAEEYFKKALTSFKKLNSKDDIARVARLLAKVQEKQQKKVLAVANYDLASTYGSNTAEKKINLTDANRMNSVSYSMQTEQVSSNISLLEKSGNKADCRMLISKKPICACFRMISTEPLRCITRP